MCRSTPLYRQEKEWQALGIDLSRATMANWMLIAARDYLIPLKQRLSRELKDQPCIHADETPVQVLNEDGKSNTATSYMWVYTSGENSEKAIRIFDYKPGRAGKYPKTFLSGFKGFLQTDAYSGYDQIPGVIRCLCWAHLRRNFVEALPQDKKSREGTLPAKAIDWCNALFELERSFKELTPEERLVKRREKEEPVVEEFWQWLTQIEPEILPKSKLGQAVRYALKRKEEFTNYLRDGHCALSNAIAENAIRPFAIGRKNWLFSGSPRGADASAAIYSIVETAKANNLDPYLYFDYLFSRMPGMPISRRPDLLDNLLPWAEMVQQTCQKGKSRV